MHYRVQFLDGSNKVVSEIQAEAGSAADAFLLVADMDWPTQVVSVSVLDQHGHDVLSVSRPKRRPKGTPQGVAQA